MCEDGFSLNSNKFPDWFHVLDITEQKDLVKNIKKWNTSNQSIVGQRVNRYSSKSRIPINHIYELYTILFPNNPLTVKVKE